MRFVLITMFLSASACQSYQDSRAVPEARPQETCKIWNRPNVDGECFLICLRERSKAPQNQLVCLARPVELGWAEKIASVCHQDQDGDGFTRNQGDEADLLPTVKGTMCEGDGPMFGINGGADCATSSFPNDTPNRIHVVFCSDIGVKPQYTQEQRAEWQGWYRRP